ncbi:BQ2448_2701 [Microbotryum intermedium]|uniref:BQ2448_2701 protein n=1 Tax=Microbotryum intermedium TaxID=269621 RepID=A0A238FGI8_9BASI|nr:BQ2448_2701 [Microbotryum intermedium]
MASPQKLDQGKMYLGSYLLERLAQLDVRTIQGVPGDFNLAFLDLVEDHTKLEWIGCCNELNSAYAADGYARVKQSQAVYSGKGTSRKTTGGVKGFAALITTFGVGELSAMNGIAGAYSERVPLLHIVGQFGRTENLALTTDLGPNELLIHMTSGVPSTKAQKDKFLLHHTLGDGRYNAFERAAESITAAQAFLQSVEGACDEIDRVIRVAFETARPAYLTLPTDLVFSPVDASRLDTPVIPDGFSADDKTMLPSGEKIDESKMKVVDFVTKEITRLWDAAKNPTILIDACAIRYGVTHLVRDLVEATQVKYYTTPMGKSALDEDPSKGFAGVYIGDVTCESVKKSFEKTDLKIFVGALQSDFNSGEFSQVIGDEEKIELHSDRVTVQYANYPTVSFHTILPALAKSLKPKKVEETDVSADQAHEIPHSPANEMVTQAAFWPMWGEFLQENDIILTETGTSSFGFLDVPLPKGATYISQTLYGSIGWAGGALLGACLAAREAGFPRRTLLFIGDGSLQLTVQDISTMLRHGLKPILVLLDNDGYVIERKIHGENRVYNDIATWKWQEMLSFFNGNNIPTRTYLAKTRGELESILADDQFAKADVFQLLQVKLDHQDAPAALIRQGKLSEKLNRPLPPCKHLEAITHLERSPISDTFLTSLSNTLGIVAVLLIVVFQFVEVNAKRQNERESTSAMEL